MDSQFLIEDVIVKLYLNEGIYYCFIPFICINLKMNKAYIDDIIHLYWKHFMYPQRIKYLDVKMWILIIISLVNYWS